MSIFFKTIILAVIIALTPINAFAADSYVAQTKNTSSQYFSIADGSQTGLDLTTAFTFEAWARFNKLPDATTYKYYGIVSKMGTGIASTRGYQYYIQNSSGTYRMRIVFNNAAGQEDSLYVTWTPAVDTWYHLAVTWNGSTKKANFYLNGLQQGAEQTGTYVATLNDASYEFRVSSDGQDGHYFNGMLDEVRVWNIVKTQTQIYNDKACELTGSETGLVGYWKFENNANDETANNNDLTAVNSPTYVSTTTPSVSGTCTSTPAAAVTSVVSPIIIFD